MLTSIRKRPLAALAAELVVVVSVSVGAAAQPAPEKDGTAFASDGKVTFGERALTLKEINRSFQPRLAGYVLENVLVSGLVGDGDELTIEVAVSPAAVTDGTSNTIMFGELVLRRSGFMEYVDDDCMFAGASARTVEEGLICGALAHAWNGYLRAKLAGTP